MSIEELKALIGHRIFVVVFQKRTNGEFRKMRCRFGVRAYLREGGKPAYDFSEKGLVNVYDMDKRAYRCFPLAAVIDLRCGRLQWEDGRLVEREKDDYPRIHPRKRLHSSNHQYVEEMRK